MEPTSTALTAEPTFAGVLCNGSDGFSAATESAYHAYPGVVARALDADVHDIAFSGKGATRCWYLKPEPVLWQPAPPFKLPRCC